jgi:hypothetical protein
MHQDRGNSPATLRRNHQWLFIEDRGRVRVIVGRWKTPSDFAYNVAVTARSLKWRILSVCLLKADSPFGVPSKLAREL